MTFCTTICFDPRADAIENSSYRTTFSSTFHIKSYFDKSRYGCVECGLPPNMYVFNDFLFYLFFMFLLFYSFIYFEAEELWLYARQVYYDNGNLKQFHAAN